MDPKEDLMAIRNMMDRSSKFLSLSGLSGVFAGCCALAGAAVVYFFRPESVQLSYEQAAEIGWVTGSSERFLVAVGLVVFVVAVLGAFYFSIRKARKAKLPFWTKSTARLFVHLAIPFVTGAAITLILIARGQTGLVAPLTLIFYGLALVNAGKFTLSEIHYLGLTEIVLGILAFVFVHNGLVFWVLGFGVLHLIYGAVMWVRYER